MHHIPRVMVNPTSATSLNYLNNLTDTLDNIDYLTELLIPLISVNQTLSQTTSEHIHPLRRQWEIHFHCEQLTFDHQQREATYHWVAHLFTVHPIRIYHPTFGLTPLTETPQVSSNLSLPRTSQEETLIIPPASQCAECKLACDRIQQINRERLQSQALELNILQAFDCNSEQNANRPDEPDLFAQTLREIDNGQDLNSLFRSPISQFLTDFDTSRYSDNVSNTLRTAEPSALSKQRISPTNPTRKNGSITAGPSSLEPSTTNALHPKPP